MTEEEAMNKLRNFFIQNGDDFKKAGVNIIFFADGAGRCIRNVNGRAIDLLALLTISMGMDPNIEKIVMTAVANYEDIKNELHHDLNSGDGEKYIQF